MSQLSLFDGKTLRDDAMERVLKPTFTSKAIPFIANLAKGEYTGEDIRILLSKQGIVPHHYNAWGALIMQAIRLGLLTSTGKTTPMRIKTSHAHRTPIYFKG